MGVCPSGRRGLTFNQMEKSRRRFESCRTYMIYEKKKKKSKPVRARHINSLHDADVVRFTCPHVSVVEAWVTGDPRSSFVTFTTEWDDYVVYFGNYVVWTDKRFKVVEEKEFTSKYEQIPEY